MHGTNWKIKKKATNRALISGCFDILSMKAWIYLNIKFFLSFPRSCLFFFFSFKLEYLENIKIFQDIHHTLTIKVNFKIESFYSFRSIILSTFDWYSVDIAIQLFLEQLYYLIDKKSDFTLRLVR